MNTKGFVGFVVVVVAVGAAYFMTRHQPGKNTPDANPSATTGKTPVAASAKFDVEVPRASDPQVAAAIDELLAAWDRVPSVFAALTTFVGDAAGQKGKTKGEGTYDLSRQDGKVLIRCELKNLIEFAPDADGTAMVTAEHLIWVYDGVYLYRFTRQPKFVQAVRKHPDYSEVLQIGGRLLMKDLVENNDLSLLPEEMLDGKATRVILAKQKNGDWRTIHWFDKSTGLRLKMEEKDPNGEVYFRVTLENIDTDSSPDPSVFTFTVPEGVPYVDETAQGP